jgi:hypothetical protein
MKIYQCRKCRIELQEKDIVFDGKIRYCNMCYVEKIKNKEKILSNKIKCDKETSAFNKLYDYLETEYFVSKLPVYMIKRLRWFRKEYNYGIMLECFKGIEQKIKLYYNGAKFKDDDHRCNYLMFVLKNDIDGYVRKNLKKIEEENMGDIKIIKVNKIQKNESINYNILD